VSAPGLIDRHLLVVTGKGGTGKTTVAAALAVLAARHGKRVLVCEMDAKGSLATAFDAEPLVYRARPLATGIDGMTMNTEDSLREYLRLFVKVPLIARIGILARTFDFVADAAPGVKEILSLGKLCYEVRERTYDLVVVDGVATGQVAAQLGAPAAIGELIQVGPVKAQTRWMQDIIEDPARTGVVVVTTPEEMPVNETVELLEHLEETVTVDVAAVVVNRVLPELFGRSEEAVFNALSRPAALTRLQRAVGESVDAVFEGARLAVAMRRCAAAEIDDLRRRLPAGQPLLYLPELFSRSTARRHLELVADALADELT
jgi:anion-transporting  ArsA/GET3 family ATPase